MTYHDDQSSDSEKAKDNEDGCLCLVLVANERDDDHENAGHYVRRSNQQLGCSQGKSHSAQDDWQEVCDCIRRRRGEAVHESEAPDLEIEPTGCPPLEVEGLEVSVISVGRDSAHDPIAFAL